MKSAKEFTKRGDARRHRCEEVYRALSKEFKKQKNKSDDVRVDGGLVRMKVGPLVGRYLTDCDDVLDPWRGCVVTLEEFSGPRGRSWWCPACLSSFSIEDIESGRRVELVRDRWTTVEYGD